MSKTGRKGKYNRREKKAGKWERKRKTVNREYRTEKQKKGTRKVKRNA